MGVSLKSSRISRLVGAVGVIWLLCAGPAWPGGGGEDAAGLLMALCQFAADFSIPCPQYPTYTTKNSPVTSPATPIVLELAAWENVTPDSLRIADSDCTQFGTLLGPPNIYCSQLAVNATNGPTKSPLAAPVTALPPPALPYLTPLAFVSKPSGATVPLTVTQYGDSAANSFFYAAVLEDKSGHAQSLDLFYDYPMGTLPVSFAVTLPVAMIVNNAATESSVVATLSATCYGPSACPNVKVNIPSLGPSSYSPASLGWTFNFYFSSSPNSSAVHPIAEVEIPLLVNPNTDPFYFLGPPTWASLPQCPDGINQISGYCNVFSQTNPPNGFAPTFLHNTVIGMAPSAAPQCPGAQPGTTCPATYPANAPQPLSPTFGFCTKFNGSRQPAVAGFLAIAPDGTTYASSPVNPAPTGVQYPACPT